MTKVPTLESGELGSNPALPLTRCVTLEKEDVYGKGHIHLPFLRRYPHLYRNKVYYMLMSKVPKILWNLINKCIPNLLFILRVEKHLHLPAVALDKSNHLFTYLGFTTSDTLPGFQPLFC